MNRYEIESRLERIESIMDKLREELEFYELEKIQLECVLKDEEISKSRININVDEEIECIDDCFEPYYFGREY